MKETTRNKKTRSADLSSLSEEQLLDMRICDLPLSIEGTWVEECVRRLYEELEAKGIRRFKPECYLTDEWLTPDKEPVIGVPFYLVHPVLTKLEEKMMLEAEGGSPEWCMKLLRHETGHALNYAYRLYKRKGWRDVFGPFSLDYPETYRFKPYSKSFVRHLEEHYAQYHPDEDFTETFAVWLTPGSDWANRYRGWRALKKLEYVDRLMKEIGNREPLVKKGARYWQATKIQRTLRRHYRQKRRFWAEEFPEFHDENLRKIFPVPGAEDGYRTAVTEIIKRNKKALLTQIARWTGEKKYVVNDQLKRIVQRCRALKLKGSGNDQEDLMKIAVYLTSLTMNYKYTGWFRGKR